MNKDQRGLAHIAIILGIIIIVLIGTIGWKVAESDRRDDQVSVVSRSDAGEQAAPSKSDDCKTGGSGLFTHDITDPSAVTLIQNPIRVIGGGNIKTHSYVEVKQRSAVYAPMDSILTGGANYYETMGPNPVTKVQYLLSFNKGCDIHYWMDHIVEVSGTIKAAFPAQARNDTQSVVVKQVTIKAGELIGYSNQSGQARFDFGVVDMKGKETILTTDFRFKDNPIVQTSDKYRHAVCPYQYFDSSRQNQYVTLFDKTMNSDQQIIDDLCKEL